MPTISPGSAQWDDWRQYFEQHLGFMPQIMQQVLQKRYREMTVPTEWPVQFDITYNTDFGWKPDIPKMLPKELRESYDDLKKRYGFSWGVDESVVDKLIPRRGRPSTAASDLYWQTVRHFRQQSGGDEQVEG